MSLLASPAPSPTPSLSELPSLGEVSTQIASVCSNDTLLCATLAGWFDNAAWAPLVASLITVLLILVFGIVIRNVVLRLITRVVARTAVSGPLSGRWRKGSQAEGIDTLLRERRRQRAETMGSVLKHIATIVIIGTTLLTVLDRLTIPIAPLLTSVGILGVAIGFGAQELVKDFIAGMFMLLEDQYGVGDVIDTGAAIGTVEAVTLRVTRLRDSDGRVWYIRNGTITRVGNESQGWSRAYMDVPVSYTSDITTVRVAAGARGRGDLGRRRVPRDDARGAAEGVRSGAVVGQHAGLPPVGQDAARPAGAGRPGAPAAGEVGAGRRGHRHGAHRIGWGRD